MARDGEVDAATALNGGSRLDALDARIIDLVRRNPRLTDRAIARRLFVAQSTISAHLRRLRERRILRIVAAIDAPTAGYDLYAWFGIRASIPVEDVAKEMQLIPEVIGMYSRSGAFDLGGSLIARNRAHLREILEQRIAKIRGLTQFDCGIVLRTLLTGPSLRVEQDCPKVEIEIPGIDELDLHVIRALQEDPRRSLSDVARDSGVSEGTVRLRLRRLEEKGLLHFVAVTDPRSVGRSCLGWVGISVDPARWTSAAAAIAAMPEVTSLGYAASFYNLFASVAVEDSEAWLQFLTSDVSRVEGANRVSGSQILRILKHDERWTFASDSRR